MPSALHRLRLALLLLLLLPLTLGGCQTNVAREALELPPESLEQRKLQTRRFDGISEVDVLAASAGVLQDLGFNLDDSEASLGVIVASKQRTAVDSGQLATAILLALVGISMDIDEKQRIRASLVTRPSGEAEDVYFVRVTFQRVVWDTQEHISRIEALDDPELYQQFFEKLSKSVFLEAHKI